MAGAARIDRTYRALGRGGRSRSQVGPIKFTIDRVGLRCRRMIREFASGVRPWRTTGSVKSEPFKYPLREARLSPIERTTWDGVRSFESGAITCAR